MGDQDDGALVGDALAHAGRGEGTPLVDVEDLRGVGGGTGFRSTGVWWWGAGAGGDARFCSGPWKGGGGRRGIGNCFVTKTVLIYALGMRGGGGRRKECGASEKERDVSWF